jgi:hypothetical protein
MTSLRLRRTVITGAVALALVAAGTAAGAAVASGPADGSGAIHGCYSTQALNGSHVFVLQDAGTTCPKGTTAISWNQTGPAGATGPQDQQERQDQPGRRDRQGLSERPARLDPQDRRGRSGTPGHRDQPAPAATRCSTEREPRPAHSAMTGTSTSTPRQTPCTGRRPEARGRPPGLASSAAQGRKGRRGQPGQQATTARWGQRDQQGRRGHRRRAPPGWTCRLKKHRPSMWLRGTARLITHMR